MCIAKEAIVDILKIRKNIEYLIDCEKRERTENLTKLVDKWPHDLLRELVVAINDRNFQNCDQIIQLKKEREDQNKAKAQYYGYVEMRD